MDNGGSSKDGAKDSLTVPLAEAARPSKIHEYVGQDSVLGKESMLYTVLESGDLPSLIFWGPPGCGKVGLGTGQTYNYTRRETTVLKPQQNGWIQPFLWKIH